jgi:uncharacterized protein
MKSQIPVLEQIEGAVEVLEDIYLLKEKAVWCNRTKSLFIADTHFGKAGHFRKAGIAIPESVHLADYRTIELLIERYRPEYFYFLGDLFHSSINNQWLILEEFLEGYDSISFILIKGNHDILPKNIYKSSVLQIFMEPILIGSLLLSHEPMDAVPEGQINLCGHLHPGFAVKGLGHKKTLPCFHLKKNQLILPSFGKFTGCVTLPFDPEDKIFIIGPNSVMTFN